MISSEIERALIKFLNNSASSKELDILNNWIEKKENHRLFKKYVETHFAISITMNKSNTENAKKKFLLNIRKEKKRNKLKVLRHTLKYAAIFIIVFGIAFAYKQHYETKINNEDKNKIGHREEQVTLQLGNGSVQPIQAQTNIKNNKGNTIAKNDGKQLSYKKASTGKGALIYNKLMVPYGKKYTLLLADGTHVTLNSGSSLMYPVDFVEKQQRKVYLQGEAFFDVVHNGQKPFFVEAQGMLLKVYGTAFNMKNYSEDAHTEVVLVRGSVSLTADDENNKRKVTLLEPGDLGSYNKAGKNFYKEKVDTAIYTSWLQGNIVFRDESFKNIIKDLERSYNVAIINNNEQLANEHFNAIIETQNETIEQVLNYFSKIYSMHYEVLNDKIIIN